MEHIQRLKEKKMAYVLHNHFGYTKVSIATMMKISPQQLGVWIKEIDYELKIHNLNQEIDSIKNELRKLGYTPQKTLEADILTF